MTSPAIYLDMLSSEFKTRFPVVKTKRILAVYHTCYLRNPWLGRVETLPVSRINFPALRRMAGSTVDFHVRTMRVLRKQARRKTQQVKEGCQSKHVHFFKISAQSQIFFFHLSQSGFEQKVNTNA